MWVQLKTPEMRHKISIPLPVGLLGFAGFLLRFIPEEKFGGSEMPVRKKDLRRFLSQIRRDCREELRDCKGLVLVEVWEKEGTHIKITA